MRGPEGSKSPGESSFEHTDSAELLDSASRIAEDQKNRQEFWAMMF